jgi:alkylation response protein AidB-like acyl-CoA dehydrogenase
MKPLAQYERAEELEKYLGDPLDAENVFSFARSVELDERDEYPEQACNQLDQWGFHQYHVPVEYGGRLRSFEELISLVRIIARRDLTVAVAYVKTYLGAVAVWVAGDDEQRHRLARIINNGGQVALALTEREHGSDILASDAQAVRTADGYVLSGEKWLINNATRSSAMTVFARTGDHSDPRGFSMFLIEKNKVDKSSYTHLPKVKTHGLHGADISGINFHQCKVAPDSLIGSPGSGAEIALKMLQVTRSIVPALSLGAADTALRATMSFALRRRLYGKTVFAIPLARKTLVDAFLDLLICECLAVSTVRAIHVAPQQMSILSAVAKYYVPVTAEDMINNLSAVLGARYYLREGHWSGVFQKIVRDNAIASLFDGNTAVNLNAISLQLRQLAKYHAKPDVRGSKEIDARLESIFTLSNPLPAFNPNQLDLYNRGRNDVLQGMEPSLSCFKARSGFDFKVAEEVMALAGEVIKKINALYESLATLTARDRISLDKSFEGFDLSKRYCRLHAAAACVRMWIHNSDSLGQFFAEGKWLVAVLERLMSEFEPDRKLEAMPYQEEIAEELVRLYQENLLFSIIPVHLSGERGAC